MDNQELLKRAFFEIKKLKEETSVLKSPIAVIGMGCQFPGNVQNIQDYWDLITSKTDATQNISDERWEELLNINLELKEAISSRNGGYLDRVDLFDADFFQITPREAKLMDPQHRFLLEVAWQAMENGNTTVEQLRERKTGVFVGMTLSDYGQLTINEASNDTYGLTGSAMNAGAGRVAYLLGLNGPAITYDTACSSSLVALDGAIKSLRSGEADCAFAGGVNLITGPNSSIFIARAGMSSPDGKCYSFDQKASGMARGEGCGMVLLKRLDDAIADGDTIYSVIRESAINNNGNGSGFTVPNGPMQVSLMHSVYKNLDITPQEVDYVEAHGTGTSLGDPIEIHALQEVYGQQRIKNQPLFVGSVKTNLGHLESAAGIAGFIKASLALYHKTIPPQLFFDTPNQYVDWESLNIRVATEVHEWSTKSSLRKAAVSSFGASGTNAHLVLEEAPKSTKETKYSSLQEAILTISARNKKALKAQVVQWIDFLKNNQTSYADICHSSNCSRSHLSMRLTLIAKEATDAIEKLERFLNDEPVNDIKTSDVVLSGKIKTSWIFTGQGAQYPGMGKNLYENFPLFKSELDTCSTLYEEITKESLINILFTANDTSQLEETVYTQPAIFCLEYALAKLLISWGMKPDLMIGHSVGEYVAATIAGVFQLEDAIRIIAKRGALIQSLPKEGTMAVLFTDEATVQPLLIEGAVIAALNSPENTVVSGKVDAVRQIIKNALALGIKGKELTVSHAFHSELMTPILTEFKQQFEHIKLSKPQIPIVSNVTGKVESELFTTAQYWTDHIRESVNFIEGVNVAIQHGCNAFIEIGPTQTLIHSAKQIAGLDNKSVWTSTLNKDKSDTNSLLSALAVLHTHHLPIEWECIHGDVFPKSSIPLYAFQRESYWIKAQEIQRTIVTKTVEETTVPSVTTSRIIASEDRHAYLSGELAQMIYQATDIDPERMDHHAHFFQSGLDSIILITIRQEIERRFGVSIAMGMFYEETSTIHLLTEFIFQKAPESIYAVQTEIRTEEKIQNPTVEEQTVEIKPVVSDAFVPFKRINVEASNSLNQKALDSLKAMIANINKRTAKSKEQTAHYRNVLANNRSVAGFKPEWKEMLYQIITKRAEGSKIWDIDGNEYIDLTMGFGVQLFGHNPSFIMDSVNKEMTEGFTVGPMSHLTGEVAEQLCQMTAMERAAFYNSGTEAIMVAMRLARTYTNKTKIVIFSGSYHGTFDGVLAINSGEHAIPMVPGTTQGAVNDIVVLKYGDKESLKIIESMQNELAAVIVEPVQSRRPDLQPRDFLHSIKAISAANDFALIFDEVITGFRAHPQGAQGLFGVEADLAVYGKIIGGGLPIGIVAGKARYLDAIDGGHWKYGDTSYPSVRTTFAAGTFCHHPLALAAARSVLQRIKSEGPEMQENLNEKTRQLSKELNAFFIKESLPFKVTQFASLFRFVLTGNGELLYYKLLEKGIYVWEGRNCFLSTAHSDEDIRRIIDLVKESALELREAELIQSTDFQEQSVSSTQNRVFMLSQNEQAEQGYHLPEIFELNGKVDVSKIETVFEQLIDRHESLRSSFIMRGEEVIQRIHSRVDFNLILEKRHKATTRELIESISDRFDLSQPSLMRVKLVEINPDEFRLVFNVHHIAFDGFSMITLLKDFVSLYQGYALPTLTYSYRDFVKWEQAYKQSPEFEKDAAFWTEKFQGQIPQIELPSDRKRGIEPSFEGYSVHLRIDQDATDKIRSFARSQGVSMYMLTLSAYYLLLNRYSGQDDLVIGTPVGGRSQTEFRDIIGMFVNTLALRESIDEEQSVSAFIRQISKSNLTAFEHENYPFDDLYKQLNPERIPNRNPLFDAFFTYESHAALSVDLGDTKLKWVDPVRLTSKFDLKLEIQDSDQLDIYLGYKTALFDESSMSRMSTHYAQLLNSIVENSDKPIKSLRMITSKEEEQLLHTFNDTSVEYDRNVLLIDLFEQVSASKGSKVALVEGDRSMSYDEVNSISNRLIHQLHQQFTLKEGDVVAILLPRCIEGICGALAALKGACAFMFVDINYPKDRIEHMLQDSGAKAILSFPEYFELAPAGEMSKFLDIRTIENTEVQNPKRNPENRNPLAYLIYTSGSTGKPKGTLIPNQAILNYTRGIIEKMEFTDQDEALHLLATGFDAGFTYIWSMLTIGATLHIVKDKKETDPEYVIDYIAEHNITFIKWIPTYFKLICQHDSFKNGAFNSLRTLMLGGEAVNASDLIAFREAYPSVQLFDHYGPTESTVGCLGRWMTDDLERYTYEQVIGKPFSNYKAYVFNDAMQLQPVGVEGELHIGGDSLANGYNGQLELTASRFVPNPYIPGEIVYKTGDFVKRLPSGDIVFLQRKDNQVKINGYRIEIGEIQLAIQQIEGVRDVYTTTRSTETGSQILAYYIANDISLDAESLRLILLKTLPDYMIPAHFIVVDSFPFNDHGKIDRKALPLPEQIIPASSSEDSGTRTDEERILAEIWVSVLNRESIGIDENYFSIGGDSIKSILIISRLRKHGLKLGMDTLFNYPTIRQLATKLERKEANISQEKVNGTFPLTPIQNRFFVEQKEHLAPFNLSFFLKNEDPWDIDAIKKTLGHLMNHHDMLRVAFNRSVGQTIQPEATVRFEEIQVSDLTNIDVELQRIQKSIQPEEGVVIQTTCFRSAEDEVVFISTHHLISDAISSRILLEDFVSTYHQVTNGQSVKLQKKTDSFKSWSEFLQKRTNTGAFDSQNDYWKTVISSMVGSIHHEIECKTAYQSDRSFLRHSLNKKETDRLKQANGTFNTKTNELLLTAIARSTEAIFGIQRQAVMLEGHGRESLDSKLDLTRTIGWFTSYFPASIHSVENSIENLKEIKEVMRFIPDNGVGYDALIQIRKNNNLDCLPQLKFNYIGQIESTEKDGSITIRENKAFDLHSEMSLQHDLEIVSLETNGELHIDLYYHSGRFTESTMNKWLTKISAEIVSLANDCLNIEQEKTPSDLVYSELSAETFDQLLAAKNIKPSEIDDIYPVSSMQEVILFHTLSNPEAHSFVMHRMFSISGPLDIQQFKESWQSLLDRNTLLRGLISTEYTPSPVQIIRKKVAIDFQFVDLINEAHNLEHELTKFKELTLDLLDGSLIRVAVFQTKPDHFKVCWKYHHILQDGWSSGILLDQLFKHYGKTEMSGYEAQYVDYIRWYQQQDLSLAKSFWQDRFSGYERRASILPCKEILADENASFVDEDFFLSEEATSKLEAIGHEFSITLNTLIQATWSVLCAKHSGSHDVVFGATVSGRPTTITGINEMVGLFINTVPVRSQLDPTETFKSFAQSVQERNIQAERFHHYSLADIQSHTSLNSDLLDHVLIYENYPLEEEIMQHKGFTRGDLFIDDIHIDGNNPYNFSVEVVPGKRLYFKMTYNERVIQKDFITLIQKDFKKLLEHLPIVKGNSLQFLESLIVTESEIAQQHAFLDSMNDLDEDF